MPHQRFEKPFEIANEQGGAPAVFIVEHARNFIPAAMNGLGVEPARLEEHIAWDIGIEGVARRISDDLGIPAIYCLYSRLIVDVNRPEGHPQMFWPESDGVAIPGNRDIADEECEARLAGIYRPYHAAASALVDRVRARHGDVPVFSMHSCTRQLRGQPPRPWEVGLSTYESDGLMERFARLLEGKGLNAGRHQPYDVRDYYGTSIDRHGREKGLPHILVEVRQDLIGDGEGQENMADILAPMIRALIERD